MLTPTQRLALAATVRDGLSLRAAGRILDVSGPAVFAANSKGRHAIREALGLDREPTAAEVLRALHAEDTADAVRAAVLATV